MVQKQTFLRLIYGVTLALIFSFSAIVSSAEQPTTTSYEHTAVDIGIYAISIGNFEFNKGTYVIDFYVILHWNDKNITPTGFEFMNGRPMSKEKIFEMSETGQTEVWYRLQANLFITPDFTKYPFDTQQLKIIIEDSKFNTSFFHYTPNLAVCGVDDGFQLAGWDVESYLIEVHNHTYPWNETYSQMVFTINLARATGPTAAKLLLPPIIFCIVSGLSFFFKGDKITHRLGLGTSMLISAVMFHLSQTSSLPALPSLILIDKIMISVYAFLASSLLATTLIYIDEEYWKDVDYTKIVNRFGAMITIILPFVVFAILNFV
ncbi:MAG: hypothetical protein QXL17_03450 [Candidatus Thermoplasmatota archaeon]